MKVVNKIFWDTDKISMITNHLDADTHSHLMLQLFVGVDDYVEIVIKDIRIKCNVIVVNKNVAHSFSAKGKLYFSSIIDPTSVYGKKLIDKMGEKDFLIYDQIDTYELSRQVKRLLHSTNVEQYKYFYKYLLNYLELSMYKHTYDERISSIFQILDTCKCTVSAKYCYAAHESRLHQNDRCKRFALCLVLTVRFRSLAPWGKLFQLFI